MLPLIILENHSDALEHILRHIGKKSLPFKGMLMVHFDSHPDLSIPSKLDKCLLNDKQHILDSVDICSWIIPLLYNGHVSHVAWMKPHWSQQIQCGTFNFKIGKHKQSQQLKCTLAVEYFVSELEYCDARDLTDLVDVTLTVLDYCAPVLAAAASHSEEVIKPKQYEVPIDTVSALQHLICSHPAWILDVDLDSFATIDPFKKLLPNRHYELLQQLYSFQYDDSVRMDNEQLETILKKRKDQLSGNLKMLHKCMNDNADSVIQSADDKMLRSVLRDGGSGSPGLDPAALHEAGLSIPQPQYVPSGPGELTALVSCATSLLRHCLATTSLQARPTRPTRPRPSIVTIARSSWDEYCPRDLVDHIQNEVIDGLLAIYGGRIECTVTNDYQHYYNTGTGLG